MTNKRWINVRPLFVVFAGVVTGILTYYGLCSINLNLKYATAYFVCGASAFALAVISILLALIFKNKHKLFAVLYKHTANFVLFVIFSIVGIVCCYNAINDVFALKTYEGGHIISGKVTQVSKLDTYTKLVLENVEIDLSEKLDGQLVVSVVSPDEEAGGSFKIGDNIMFQADIDLSDRVSNKIELSSFTHGGTYRSYVTFADILFMPNNSNFIDEVRSSIKSVVDENFNEDNAGIVLGVLLGEKDELNADVQDNFSLAGVSHMLAVSGLHVGFLVGMLLAVFKLFKVKLKYSIFPIAVILLFYCALCYFTPSVMRASFMAIILLASRLLGERYDGLSSLSLAGTCILLVFPLDLFSLSFQLSFLCVFSIITLAPSFTRLLSKIKLPKFIASTLAISICVNLAILPICANAFTNVSLMGIFSNIIVIPLFSVTYPILFLFVAIRLILPFVNFIFVVPNVLIHLIKLVVNIFASITFLNFKLFNVGYLIVFFVITFALVLQYLMVNKYVKGGICGMLFVVILTLFISNNLNAVYTSNTLNTYGQYNEESAVLTSEDNQIYLIGYDKYTTNKLLNGMRVRRVDYWVLYNFNLNSIDEYNLLVDKMGVKRMVIPKKDFYNDYTLEKLSVNVEVVLVEDTYRAGDYEISFLTHNNKMLGTLIRQPKNNLLFVDDLTENQFLYLNNCNLPEVDYMIVNELPNNPKLLSFEVKNIITSNEDNFEYPQILLSTNKKSVIEL